MMAPLYITQGVFARVRNVFFSKNPQPIFEGVRNTFFYKNLRAFLKGFVMLFKIVFPSGPKTSGGFLGGS